MDQSVAGLANKATFGGTNWLREKLYGDTATQNHEGAFYQGGEFAGEVATSVLPTGAFKGAKWAQQAVGGYNKARNIYDRFQDVSAKVGSINNILNGCGGLEDLQTLAGGSFNPLGNNHTNPIDTTLSVVRDLRYKRPKGYRKDVRNDAWENAKGSDGYVRDPLTNDIMDPTAAWQMGHKPGYEFRKHQASAETRNIDRKQFLDEHNDASHYHPELPSSNASHAGEDHTSTYLCH